MAHWRGGQNIKSALSLSTTYCPSCGLKGAGLNDSIVLQISQRWDRHYLLCSGSFIRDRVTERDSNIPSSGGGIFPSSTGLLQDTRETAYFWDLRLSQRGSHSSPKCVSALQLEVSWCHSCPRICRSHNIHRPQHELATMASGRLCWTCSVCSSPCCGWHLRELVQRAPQGWLQVLQPCLWLQHARIFETHSTAS